jgi:uncharacterized protein (TIGR03067 family)
MPEGDPAVEAVSRERRRVLDEELSRLAPKYRGPLVLFYLEGKRIDEVARQLGCPKGTVLSRLARGRDRLRDRLVRRGVGLSVGVTVGVLIEKAAPEALPATLAMRTVNAAATTAAGQAAGAIPATVAALTKGVLRAMFLSKVKVIAAVAIGVMVAALGTVVGARQPSADRGAPQAPADKPAAAAKQEASKDAEKIVGTWAIVSAERGGKKVAEEMFQGGKWIFSADGKVTAKFRGEKAGLGEAPELKGTYKLEPGKKPKEITITSDGGKKQPSIYKLDGDSLTICMGDSDVANERPTEFATKEGSKIMLLVLKRQKK